MTETQTLCGAVAYEDSEYPCTRELGHGTSPNEGVIRNRMERTHICKIDGIRHMIWDDTEE